MIQMTRLLAQGKVQPPTVIVNGKPVQVLPIQPNTQEEEIVEVPVTETTPQEAEEIPVEVVESSPRREKVIERVEQRIEPIQRTKIRRKYAPKQKEDYTLNEDFTVNYSPSFQEVVRNRLRYVFEPIIGNTSYQSDSQRIVYKPRYKTKQKVIYKPTEVYKQREDYDYEPSLLQIVGEDYAPRQRQLLAYAPQVVQEAYPTYTYATYGLPDTYVDDYAPEDSVKIKPITEFEIHAKPTPLIVSQAHLLLLNRLIFGGFR